METITYRLQLENGNEYVFPIHLDGDRGGIAGSETPPPSWTALENRQCANCPLKPQEHPHCPAALAIHHIADRFGYDLSIERVNVRVETRHRDYCKETDLQSCLRSVFGLAMSTSACPILSRLRPMARHHLPFASVEETLLRAAGSYLIKQHLVAKLGRGQPDWSMDGLFDLYGELEIVNAHLMSRLRTVSKQDANVNAMNTFFSISCLVGMSLDPILSDMFADLEEVF